MNGTLNIAIVQSPLHWENPQKNRISFSQKIRLIPEDVDLIVLPEMFTSGFTMTPSNIDSLEGPNTVEWMKEMAMEKHMAIVGSLIFGENGKTYNRLFFVYPNGEYKSYDKKHTFTLAGEDQVYEAGSDKLVLEYRDFKICPLICYDLRFPVWARNLEDYDLLVFVANWPKPRIDAWDTLLKARAIENMSYCIGANRIGLDGLGYEYPGHSAIYDCLGKRMAFSDTEEILYATLQKNDVELNRNKLRFLEDRDEFSLK